MWHERDVARQILPSDRIGRLAVRAQVFPVAPASLAHKTSCTALRSRLAQRALLLLARVPLEPPLRDGRMLAGNLHLPSSHHRSRAARCTCGCACRMPLCLLGGVLTLLGAHLCKDLQFGSQLLAHLHKLRRGMWPGRAWPWEQRRLRRHRSACGSHLRIRHANPDLTFSRRHPASSPNTPDTPTRPPAPTSPLDAWSMLAKLVAGVPQAVAPCRCSCRA